MQSAIIVQQVMNPLLTNFEVNGDLRLNQIAPLHCHHRFKYNHYNYSVISLKNKHNIPDILFQYNKRNSKYANNINKRKINIFIEF